MIGNHYPSLYSDPVFGIHLQWFAAEDEGRTEDPTERKIRKAREDGKVAKSADITSAVVMIFGLITLMAFSGSIIRITLDMIRYFITMSTSEMGTSSVAFTAVGNYLLRLASPVMAVCFVAAFLGNVVQVGFLFSTKPITPDFSKIAPNVSKWAQKSFFSAEALFNLFKSIAKVAIIVILAYVNIKSEVPRLTNAIRMSPFRSLTMVSGIAMRLMLETAILLLAFALPDYYFQRHQHRESLKMSKHEIKEEFKETEGDPLIKSRLRQRMQEVLSSSMARQVPEADVVITNPTHFAVALKWDNQTMQAPTVTAKGMDNLALRIKEIARGADVPMIENRPLARALYDNVEIGDEVPEAYWDIVSVVLAEIYRLNGKAV
ncbi:MAG: flagellar biosynthesis protein FlhB [Spirochaetes bacterium]|nr:MAG: flagellar biosynthesis protein FlhB [Spirochaetota bacterium]RKX80150.1 MAG: flagellar biosynthesis protein FlhB [Spirochaetota bacterium]